MEFSAQEIRFRKKVDALRSLMTGSEMSPEEQVDIDEALLDLKIVYGCVHVRGDDDPDASELELALDGKAEGWEIALALEHLVDIVYCQIGAVNGRLLDRDEKIEALEKRIGALERRFVEQRTSLQRTLRQAGLPRTG
jgi:hypothetical protein